MSLPPDYHVHTKLCHHASGETSDYAASAVRRGMAELCFTDHAPAPCGYDAKYRMAVADFDRYLQIVDDARHDGRIPVCLGIEADYYEGCREFQDDWLSRGAFDMVLGSVHYIGDWGFDSPENSHIWEEVDVTAAWREYFSLVGCLADSGLYDVLGHLDLPKKFGYRPSDRDLDEMARPALDRIAAAGMGIEINTGGLRKPVAEIYPAPRLLSLARERAIPITFGSDAHNPEDVGYAFEEAVALAGEAGYSEYVVFRKRERTNVPLEG